MARRDLLSGRHLRPEGVEFALQALYAVAKTAHQIQKGALAVFDSTAARAQQYSLNIVSTLAALLSLFLYLAKFPAKKLGSPIKSLCLGAEIRHKALSERIQARPYIHIVSVGHQITF